MEVPMNASDAILKVLEQTTKLLKEKGWIRDATAVDDRGRIVAYSSRRAAKFDLPGAILRAEHDLKLPVIFAGATAKYLNQYTKSTIVTIDRNAASAEDILKVCRKAKEEIEKEARTIAKILRRKRDQEREEGEDG